MVHLPISIQIIIVFIFGICLGSFLNVCIDRLPKGESIVHPGSHCPYCQKPIPWYLNIPLLSWLYLKGQTKCCQNTIPFRYFLSEIGVGIGAITIYLYFKQLALPHFLLFCFLWVAFFTDLNTLLIPDEISLLGITTGVLISYFFPQMHHQTNAFTGMLESIKCTCLGMGGLFCFICFAEFFLKKEAMGLGDVKLIGCIGAFLGLEGCMFSLFFGAILGSFLLILYGLYKKIVSKNYVSLKNKCIPFGPFLTIAAIIYMFFPHTFLNFTFE